MYSEAIRLESINKQIEHEPILNNLSFFVKKGETIGIYGSSSQESAALIDILTGAEIPDSGRIFINGNILRLKRPLKKPLHFIQAVTGGERMDNNLSVAENLFLGCETGFFTSPKKTCAQAREYLDDAFLTDIAADMPASLLSDRQHCLLELARLLVIKPYAVIFNQADIFDYKDTTTYLFEIFKRFNKMGISVLYISNSLESVLKICSRTAIIAMHGSCIALVDRQHFSYYASTEALTQLEYLKGIKKNDFSQEITMEVNSLSGKRYLQDLSFKLHTSEILGIYSLNEGLHRELFDILYGNTSDFSGTIYVDGKLCRFRSPREAIDKGIVLCPSFKHENYFPNMTLKDNILMSSYCKCNHLGFRNMRLEDYYYNILTEKTALDTSSGTESVSPDNVNKSFLARSIGCNPRILLLSNPFFQISYETEFDILRSITSLSSEGVSIIIASNNLRKLNATCHRVIQFHSNSINIDKEQAW